MQLSFDGVVGYPGLYQFNFVVPAGVGSGDQALSAMVNGVTTPGNVFIQFKNKVGQISDPARLWLVRRTKANWCNRCSRGSSD